MYARALATLRTRGRPPALLLLAGGMLAGSFLAAPQIGLGAVTPASVQTRAASCWANAFHPIDSETSFTIGGSNAIYRNAPGGGGAFRCDLDLPHRAVVTKVQSTDVDFQSDGQVGQCLLLRVSLLPASASALVIMASVPETGYTQMPGVIRRVDKSISHATIDNSKYAYTLQCDLSASGPSAGLYGASVSYTISATNG